MARPSLPKLSVKPSKNFALLLAAVVLFVIALVPSIYFYNQYQKLKNPTTTAQQEVDDIVAKVGKLIELPKGENPTVASVSDKSKLTDQPFFAKAENGDKVLIYTKAKKAILYRPSTNKIIEVAPVNLGANQGAPSVTPAKEKIYKVALFNGTTTVGLTKTFETRILDQIKNVEILAKENASKSTYEGILVVNLTNADSSTSSKLAEVVGGKLGSLPEGEKAPAGTDFLIILGK